MKYVLVFCMIFGLWGCESSAPNQDNMAGSGGEAGSAGAAGSGGAVACGPSACGACEEGCRANDQCVDGQWQCGCDCGDGGQGGDAGQGNDDCGPMVEDSCPANCALMQTCIDGQWDTYCECGIPSCFVLCQAWSSNLVRCVESFEETEAFLTSCEADCQALADEAELRTFADCTAQLEECSTLLERCSEYVPTAD